MADKIRASTQVRDATINLELNTQHNTTHLFKDVLLIWFADVASVIRTGKRIWEVKPSEYRDFMKEILSTLRRVRDEMKEKESKAERRGDKTPLRLVGELMIGNDARHHKDLFNIDKDISLIEQALANGGSEEIGLALTGIAVDFGTALRGYLPAASYDERDKKKVIEVEKHLIPIALLGAYLSRVDQYTYVFPFTEPILSNLDAVNEMRERNIQIAKKLFVGERVGSYAERYIGLASATASALAKHGMQIQHLHNAYTDVVIIERTGNKALIKLFSRYLTYDAIYTLFKLNLHYTVYDILMSIPSKESPTTRTYRRFTSELCNALMKYIMYGELQYLYEILRNLTSESINNAGKEVLGDKWGEIVERLLSVRV